MMRRPPKTSSTILPPRSKLITTKLFSSTFIFIFIYFKYIITCLSTMEEQIAQIEQLYNKIPQQLIAQLTTILENYKLPHQQLELSSELDEDALNLLLKDMLEQAQIPRFQFIVEGHILRGKLKSHILRYQLTAEHTLNFQYILAFPQLEHETKAEEQDWVAALVTLPEPEGINYVGAALYSGVVSIYSPSLKLIGKFSADEEPLKSLQFVPASDQNYYYCLSGGLGERLVVHLLNLKNSNLEAVEISNNKHNGNILAIAISPGTDSHIATAGANGQLNIWHIPEGFDEAGKFNSAKNKKKRKQTTLNVLPLLSSAVVHQGSIDCLNWITNEEVVTGSSQHNISITDVVRMEQTQTFLTRDSIVTSLDSFGDKILSAHEDGQLRLWDRRDSSRPVSTFKGHSKWASSVRFGKTALHFASGSYDHTVKLWDLRCSFPLQNLQTQEEKVLGVQWVCDRSVVSGGSDSALHLHRAN